MHQYLVDKQISLQYLTQLLQNDDFEIKKYQRRSNLLNADDLGSRQLLILFRQFQEHLLHGLYQKKNQNNPIAKPIDEGNAGDSPVLSISAAPKQGSGEDFCLDIKENQEDENPKIGKFDKRSQSLNMLNNKNQNHNNNLFCGVFQSRRNFSLEIVKENEQDQQILNKVSNLRKNNIHNIYKEESDQVKRDDSIHKEPAENMIHIEMEEGDFMEFPKSMQKYAFKEGKICLKDYRNQVSKSVLRRLAFLSVSGYLGFDDNERVEFIKGAFLLEFDTFFKYLAKPIIMNLLKFDENPDEALEIIVFMWNTDMRKAMRYYNFIAKLAVFNPKLHMRKLEISPNVLQLDVTLFETQLLPLVNRLLSSDSQLSQKQIRLNLAQLIEYYEVHTSKKIYFPLIQQESDKEIILQVESRFESLIKEFECPICCVPFRVCHTTKCGHSFCQECILGVIQKFKSCPVCQQGIESEDELIRNFHMSEIQKISQQEVDQTKTYELNRARHISSFKSIFQHCMHTNIISSLHSQIEKGNGNPAGGCNSSIQCFDQLQKLKKQIQYLVNITFDQVMASFEAKY